MGSRLALGIAFVFAGVAAGLSLWAASPYPGTTVDSGEYLAVADGLANGYGLSMPYVSYDEAFRILKPGERVEMTQFPPLYPATLAAIHEVTGADLLSSAALLGSACFFFSVLLACLMVWEHGRDVKLVALAGGLLLASQLVTLHSMVWSEGPMILGLMGALYLTQRVARTGATAPLIAAALFAVAASLTRYVAMSFAIAIGIALIGRISRIRAGLLSLVCLVPIAVWFVRNAIVSGAASEKTLAWHPPAGRHLVQGAQAIGSWVVPGEVPAGIVGTVATLAILVWVFRRFSSKRRPLPSALRTCIIFGSCYLGVVVLARIFLDLNIPFDTRILSPLQVIAIVSVCLALSDLQPERRRALVFAAVALVASGGAVRGIKAASDFARLPVAGYTGEEWRHSETLAYVGDLPESVAVITNTPDPIWIWYRRPSHFLPPRSNIYGGEPNENYTRQLQDLRVATSCSEAVLVFFDRPTRKPVRSIDPVIVAEMELSLERDLSDGDVYKMTPGPCNRRP